MASLGIWVAGIEITIIMSTVWIPFLHCSVENNVDPDEMLSTAEWKTMKTDETLPYNLGLHCLLRTVWPKTKVYYSNAHMYLCWVLHNNPKYWARYVFANSVDPDQMLQNAASDQGLHCLSYIQKRLYNGLLFQILGQVW